MLISSFLSASASEAARRADAEAHRLALRLLMRLLTVRGDASEAQDFSRQEPGPSLLLLHSQFVYESQREDAVSICFLHRAAGGAASERQRLLADIC